MLNENKVAFIICSNDMAELSECEFYLSQLKEPQGVETEVIVITDAVSIAAGYNQAMRESDAKYKVYMHHDTMILNAYFISDMLRVFRENKEVGLLGVIGTNHHVDNGVYFDAWDTGLVYTNYSPYMIGCEDKIPNGLHNAVAVDGLMLMTQYDIAWREDVFKGWDFYDVSQCFEFTRAGYKIGIPYQNEAWCWHDTETSRLQEYNLNCAIMKKEYQDIYPFDETSQYPFSQEQKDTLDEFEKLSQTLLAQQERVQLHDILKQYYTMTASNLNLILLSNICEIDSMERKLQEKNRFWKDNMDFATLKERLTEMKFAVKRVDLLKDTELLEMFIEKRRYSAMAWITVIIIYAKNREYVTTELCNLYQRHKQIEEVQYVNRYIS